MKPLIPRDHSRLVRYPLCYWYILTRNIVNFVKYLSMVVEVPVDAEKVLYRGLFSEK